MTNINYLDYLFKSFYNNYYTVITCIKSYEKLEETPKGGSVEQVDATITAIAAVLKSQYRDTNQRLNLNIPQEIINALNYIYAIAAVGATIGRKATDQVFVKIESEFINEIGNPILKKLIEENNLDKIETLKNKDMKFLGLTV